MTGFWRSWRGLALLLVVALAATIWLTRGGTPLEDVAASPVLPAILADRAAPIRPGAGGDATLVIYTDYRCPICRADAEALARLAARDRRLTIAWRDWPILGPASLTAARAALAAGYQGRYQAMHHALMTETDLESAIVAAGVDGERLARDLALHGAAIDARLAASDAQARGLGLAGTPAYLAGRYLARGRLGDGGFRRLIEAARAAR